MPGFPSIRRLQAEAGNHQRIRTCVQNGLHHGTDECGSHGPETGPDSVVDRGTVLRIEISDEGEDPDPRLREIADILRIHVPVPVHQPGDGNAVYMNCRHSAETADRCFQLSHVSKSPFYSSPVSEGSVHSSSVMAKRSGTARPAEIRSIDFNVARLR